MFHLFAFFHENHNFNYQKLTEKMGFFLGFQNLSNNYLNKFWNKAVNRYGSSQTFLPRENSVIKRSNVASSS